MFSGEGVIDNIFYAGDVGAGDHIITYTIISQNGCPSSTSEVLKVWALPDVNLGNDTTICGDQIITLDAYVPNAASYFWMPGGSTSPSITVDSVGIGYNSQEYTVGVTDNNSCFNEDVVTVTFINCTGIKDIDGLVNVGLYPNPNDGKFNFNIESNKSTVVDISIFDNNGKVQYELNNLHIIDNYKSEINLKDPNPGIYFISIRNETGSFVKKFLVK